MTIDIVSQVQFPGSITPDLLAKCFTPGGRLTLTSGNPITISDVTAASSIHYTPYAHNIIPLWNGTRWVTLAFSETTLALGEVTATRPYDVFAYLSSGTLALESLAWTSDTTRATGISRQDGRYCKSGDKTRLYLGTFRTTSTTSTEDSAVKRFLWNNYNRRSKILSKFETTTSWTYSSTTWRQARASSANQVEIVVGLSEDNMWLQVSAECSAVGYGMFLAIGVNSNTAIAANTVIGMSSIQANAPGVTVSSAISAYIEVPAVGRNYYTWLECANTNGLVTVSSNNSYGYSGIVGNFLC